MVGWTVARKGSTPFPPYMNKEPRVKIVDKGKRCFLKFQTNTGVEIWENVGAIIIGTNNLNKVHIKMPDGELVWVDDINVRVFEPRPS